MDFLVTVIKTFPVVVWTSVKILADVQTYVLLSKNWNKFDSIYCEHIFIILFQLLEL